MSYTELVAVVQTGVTALDTPHRGVAAIADFLSRFRSTAGQATMRGCLERLADWQGQNLDTWEPHHLGVLGVRAVVARIQAQQWSNATKAKYETALGGVLKSCWRVGLIGSDEMYRARDWQRTRVQRATHAQAAGRYVTKAERTRLWEAAGTLGKSPVARSRDQLLCVLLLLGLRREETAALDVAHISGEVLEVPGKGGKLRQILLEGWVQVALGDWLHHRGTGPGPLLRPVTKAGVLGGGRWSVPGVAKRAAELVGAAGMPDVGCHDFRRTFASDALEAGVDIAKVADWMGHANVRTTQSYDRRGLESKREAARTVWKPF